MKFITILLGCLFLLVVGSQAQVKITGKGSGNTYNISNDAGTIQGWISDSISTSESQLRGDIADSLDVYYYNTERTIATFPMFADSGSTDETGTLYSVTGGQTSDFVCKIKTIHYSISGDSLLKFYYYVEWVGAAETTFVRYRITDNVDVDPALKNITDILVVDTLTSPANGGRIETVNITGLTNNSIWSVRVETKESNASAYAIIYPGYISIVNRQKIYR